MTVIAMTREMGSCGRDVALALAEELGLKRVQHELVEHVADKMHARESSVNRFLEGKPKLLDRWGINEDDLSLFTAEEILDVAAQGSVLFRGWGASHVLRPIPHVLCVRVCAPVRTRAAILMKRIGIDDIDVAVKEIRRNDAAHARTLMHLFHVDWENPLLYDVVLNSERLPVEECVRVIKELAQQPSFQETPESVAKLNNMKIEAQIRTALRSNAATRRLTPSFEATLHAETGVVTLSGVAFDAKFKQEAERVVRTVSGVNDVNNELLMLHTPNVGP